MLSIDSQACGSILAPAHAKAGDPSAISGYLRKNDQFDEAIGKFALTYAEQAGREHTALRAAVRAGIIEVQLERCETACGGDRLSRFCRNWIAKPASPPAISEPDRPG